MFLSVITPTYNRAYILPQCYKSLVNQTCRDFEWIVVDDGSSDDTEAVVAGFINEHKINIQYIKQPNGGKHRAHNTAVQNATGELCVCVDSDDCLVQDAVAIIREFWKEKRENSIGIFAKRGSIQDQHPICASWPETLTSCTMFALINDYNFWGDTALFFKTDLLKQHLFQQFGDERFLSEANLYLDLDRCGEMLLLNRVIYLCEYLEDGLTAQYHALLRRNPMGTANTYFKQVKMARKINDKLRYAMLTNIYYSLCEDKQGARLKGNDVWLLITRIPALLTRRYFLDRFEKQEDIL